MWSLGCILYEVVSGENLKDLMALQNIGAVLDTVKVRAEYVMSGRKIESGKDRAERRGERERKSECTRCYSLSASLQDHSIRYILKQMLHPSKDERPTSAALLENDVVKGWRALLKFEQTKSACVCVRRSPE